MQCSTMHPRLTLIVAFILYRAQQNRSALTTFTYDYVGRQGIHSRVSYEGRHPNPCSREDLHLLVSHVERFSEG